MSLTKCKAVECRNEKPRRFFLCSSCWSKIPKEYKLEIKDGIAKGSHTLRTNPTRTWVEKVFKYVGFIKVPYVLGAGITAVKIAADKTEV
jgi:hypothetical protein